MIVLFVIDGLLLVVAIVLFTRPRVRRTLRLFRITAKHASCHGFAIVNDARSPGDVILRCPGHNLTHRSNPNWKPFNE